jgi:Baseplate J-like protein
MTGETSLTPSRPFDYLARDATSFLRAMLEQVPTKLPEWTGIASEADLGRVLLELFAHVADIVSYYTDALANESFLSTAQTRRSIIQHLGLIGYRLATASPSSAELVLTIPAPCAAAVVITKGSAFATKSQPDSPSVRFEYVRDDDLVIDCADFVPASAGKLQARTTVPVEEGQLVRDEILGISDGSANQRFPLAHPRLILRSLGAAQQTTPDILLLSELGGIPVEWTLQETLAFSGPQDDDYLIDIDDQDRATAVFGQAVPAAGSEIRATYRVGGGGLGNVAKDQIQTIVDAPQLTLIGAQVTNAGPATGGADRESIDHAVLHAPAVFRSLRRAVTGQDYEALALDFAGVGKVRAVPTNWNTVTLYVAPQGGGAVSDVLAANLIAYFEDKRPLSTRIEIANVDYVPVFVTAEVDVLAYYSVDQVAENVRQSVRELLSFDNVSFAQVIYLSKFYEAIEGLDGVAGVNISEFRRSGQAEAVNPEGKLTMGENEIATVPRSDDDFAGHPDGGTLADYPEGVRVLAVGGFNGA